MWTIGGKEPENTLWQSPNTGNDVFIRAMAVSPDGAWVACGDSQGTMRIWDLGTRQERVSKPLYQNDIVDLAISPNNQAIATISFDSEVAVWSADTLEPKAKFKANARGVRRIAFVQDDSVIALGEQAEVWKIDGRQADKVIAGDRFNMAIAPSRDRKQILLGSEKALRQWNVGEDEAKPFIEDSFANNELIVHSPDDKHLATANGNVVRIWDVERRQCVQVIDVIGASVAGMEWLPDSQLLWIVPDLGPPRLWGTVKHGEAVGLKPWHAPIAPLDSDSKDPASARQLNQAIDFRTFPKIPGCQSYAATESLISGEAPLSVDDAKLFYRYQLGQRGWMESTEPSTNPMAIEFRKDSFKISSSFYESGPGKTYINLSHAGNVDARWIPLSSVAPAETTFASEYTVLYELQSDITSIEVDLMRKLHQAGWTAYSRMNTSRSDEDDRRDLSFLRNAAELRVSITKHPMKSDSMMVQYAISPSPHALPIPNDSGFVEFDGSTKPMLVASTSLSLSDAQGFYDREMEKQGWRLLPGRSSSKDEHAYRFYLQDQKEVGVGLSKQKNGRTLIRVGEKLENASYQLAEAQGGDAKSAKVTADGLEAADFPILDGAKETKYDRSAKVIEFKVESTSLLDLAEKYTQAMASIGWEAEKGGIRSAEYTFFNFQKGKQEIGFRATQRSGHADVNIQGDGLLWTKALPVPDRVISYEQWLRDRKYPAGLERLDQYAREMKAIKP